MPHIRSEAKYGKSKSMADDLNEMSELANCTKCLYFESRKGRDVYLVKFLFLNIVFFLIF